MSQFKNFFLLIAFFQLIYSQNFSLTLNVSGGTSDYDLTVGFSPEATDAYDPDFDFFAPPAPPPPSFDAALVWNGDRYYSQLLAGDGNYSSHVFSIQLQFPEDENIHLEWDNSGWSTLGTVILQDPFSGVFLWVDMTTESSINLNNPALTSLELVVTPIEQEINTSDFSISFNVSGGTSDYDIIAGFSPNATDGYDSEFDFFAPPAPPPPSFDAALIWSGDRYYTQILASDGDLSPHEFTIQLQYPEDNTIHFVWDNLGWSELGSFWLTDQFGGIFITVDMTTQSELTLENPALTSLSLVITPSGDINSNPFEGHVSPTPMSGIFQGQITIDGEAGTGDDWIAAFDEDGNIAGASALLMEGGDSYVNLIIYGDDPLTGFDEGMNGDENFYLKLWISSENTILDYSESFDCWYNNNGAPLTECGTYTDIYNFGEDVEPPALASLVINEIHYNPSSDLQGSDNQFEFIEIYNAGDETVDLSGYRITLGIDGEFPEGSQISTGEFIIVAKTPDTYLGNGYQVYSFDGNIYNAGEEIELIDNYERRVDYVNYDDEGEWATEPDGGGPSLELLSTGLDNEIPSNWEASMIIGGTPGAENSVIPEDGHILVTVSTVEAYAGSEIAVPVTIHFPEGVSAHSVDVVMEGVNEYFVFQSLILDGSLPENAGWSVESNVVDNSLIIAMAGANSIAGDGLLFSLDLLLNENISVEFVPVNIASIVIDTGEETPEVDNGGVYILQPIPPAASFTAEPTTGLFPLTVSFLNTSDLGSGSEIEYTWDFGNGEFSNEESPIYVFEIPGIYPVILTLSTNHGESVSETTEINVLALYGDVDMNDAVQSFDASLVLQHIVGYIELDDIQQVIGDVNLSGELSALDASFILQYLVGLIESLPVDGAVYASGNLNIEDQYGTVGAVISVPLNVSNSEDILSFESTISYENNHLTFLGVNNDDSEFSIEFTEDNGLIHLAGASLISDESDFSMVYLQFLIDEIEAETSSIQVEELKWNENETILDAAEGQVFVMSADEHSVIPGWNLVSFDIELLESEPELVFNELIINDNLVNVTGYDENGSNFYDPLGFEFLNTLTSIEQGRGYWVKVNENDDIFHQGIAIENTFSISIWEGWSIIGYWPASQNVPQEAFSELIENDNLVYATGYDEHGFSFYDPNGLEILNTLTILENGKGYMLKVNESVDEFSYPIPAGFTGRKLVRNSNPNIIKTNSCMFINGSITLQNASINDESKIEILTENGLLVGELEIIDGKYLRTGAVYGDDKFTTKIIEGAIDGETLIFRLNDIQSNPINVSFYGNMELKKIDLVFSGIPSEFSIIGNFPNPFNPTTTIQYGLPQDGVVNVKILDILGQEIKSFSASNQKAGIHSMVWNGRDNLNRFVSAGIYFFTIEFNSSRGNENANGLDITSSQKMILLK